MIEETATVVAVDGNQVTVKSTIKSTCHSCNQQDDCGSGQIAKAIPHKALTTRFENSTTQLKVGDEVVIGLSERSIISSALQVYMLPLFTLILFAAIGQFILVEQQQMHEFFALVLAILGGYLGHLFAKFLQAKQQTQYNLQPKLLRKCSAVIISKPL
ncbi:SoxR reducing system RseC family protein [Thalassotalea psychrophila]|uniref:SoxR reducing system RseC family protein n=1 Tax=Thalassotalea psychrophila TaxID=3065647 RepID=A0ABY9TRN1_9GAMM|nr:SoxR reducing system RseC family protein [Colwelliaceae bacterium SQ149]